MTRPRVLVIGLDGFDIALADRFIAQGALPNLERLRSRSVCCDLDHGLDKYSGLAWEHVASGQAPSDGARWSAVSFDPATYEARQGHSSARPFMADLSARTVVFDLPYCDLERAPHVRGLTDWGAHDPGVRSMSQPAGLREEMDRIFGPYPAAQWIYGFCWPSVEKTRAAGAALVRAVEVRAQVARWLLAERLPDWDLAMVVVGECHSAIEPLWHGVDPTHPLHEVDSAAPAGQALRDIYVATDDLIGQLAAQFPDATLVVFAMHGMGTNDGDVPSMLLLPELLHRVAFGAPYMRSIEYHGYTAGGVPLLGEDQVWDNVMSRVVPKPASALERLLRRTSGLAGWGWPSDPTAIEWMPASRYATFWPRMRAFALPAYYDGRIRINLAGREARGLVAPDQYEATCREMIDIVRSCRNVLTGEEVVDEIHWPKHDPATVGRSEADLYVIWKSTPAGFSTPGLGAIGPIPYRRTGGHTGASGFVYMAGDGLVPGNGGVISSFDVVPTIVDLLGEARPAGISGKAVSARRDTTYAPSSA